MYILDHILRLFGHAHNVQYVSRNIKPGWTTWACTSWFCSFVDHIAEIPAMTEEERAAFAKKCDEEYQMSRVQLDAQWLRKLTFAQLEEEADRRRAALKRAEDDLNRRGDLLP